MQICTQFSLTVMNVEVWMRVNVRILTDPQGKIYTALPLENVMTDLTASSLRALKLMDLTTLNDDDTNEKVIALCHQAKTPVGNTAAVCIYPRFIPIARKTLKEQGTPDVRIATVTNFPHGNDDIEIALAETRAAIAYGADEVDVVFPYRALMAGNEQVGFDLVLASNRQAACVPQKTRSSFWRLPTSCSAPTGRTPATTASARPACWPAC